MHFTHDRYGMERPQLILCHLDKSRVCQINEIALSASLRWSDISELRFTVSSITTKDGVTEPWEYFDDVRELMYIEVPSLGYYVLRGVQEVNDGIRLVKDCIAYSAEIEFQSKIVTELTGEWRIHNPINLSNSIMAVLLRQLPGWSLGSIDPVFLVRQRSVNLNNLNLYAALRQLGELFGCVFVFDNQSFRINIIDITRDFRNTDVFISFDNLMKGSSITTLTDGIVTALHVRGANMDIAPVNPSGGGDVIYSFDYFKPRMSEALRNALNAYEVLFNSLQPAYSNLLVQRRNLNGQLHLLNNNPPTYNITFNANVNGTAQITPALNNASGLSQLEGALRSAIGVRAGRVEQGIIYTDINVIINQLNPLINTRRTAITNMENQISNIETQLTNIVNQLRLENNFSNELLIELSRYTHYDVYQNDGFLYTELTTAQERQDIAMELLETGREVLRRASFPAIRVDVDSANFFAIEEFSNAWDIELGTTFTLDMDSRIIRPLLLGIDINLDNPDDFSLIYANKHTLDSNFSLIDFSISNVNASNVISFNLATVEQMMRQTDTVTEFINGALIARVNELKSTEFNTAVTIDETGIRTRSFNATTGAFTGDSIWVTGRTIALSDNDFVSARMAIGRISFPGNLVGTGYGVVGDVLVGRILAGNNLHIETQARGQGANPQMIMDENGLRINNANIEMTRTQAGITNRIILNPLEGFSIWRGNQRTVFINANGDLELIGHIRGGSISIGTGSLVNSSSFHVAENGQLTIGGTMGNPNFRVEPSGSVAIRTGNINLGNGALILDNLGNIVISRGTINIGNGRFTVDSLGNAVMQHATITGGSLQLGPMLITPASFNLQNGNLHNSTLTNNTIGASNNIDGGAVNVGSLNADRIQANSITANQIAANAITANAIAAGAVTANAIAAGTITAQHIAAGAITADILYVNYLSAIAANLGTITAGSITADCSINVTTDVTIGRWINLRADWGGSGINIGGSQITVDAGGGAFLFNRAVGIIGSLRAESVHTGAINVGTAIQDLQTRITALENRPTSGTTGPGAATAGHTHSWGS